MYGKRESHTTHLAKIIIYVQIFGDNLYLDEYILAEYITEYILITAELICCK